MKSGFEFGQVQEQKQSFGQTQIQALKLLAMPAQELRAFLVDASYSNPMIELVDVREADASPAYVNKGEGSEYYDILENTPSDNIDEFSDILLQQIRLLKLSRNEALTCAYIVQNLDSKGWLDISLDDIAEDLHISVTAAERGLCIVQSLSPAGVAARSLSECLYIQLKRRGMLSKEIEIFLEQGLEFIETVNTAAIESLLGCSCSRALELVGLIKSLDPIPSAGAAQGETIQYIIPDASVFLSEGQLVLQINTSYFPRPTYSEAYTSLMCSIAGEDKKYLSRMKREATQIISGYERRIGTFRRVMEVIVSLQADFFRSGSNLHPMRIQDIADRVEMNASTVSRTVSNKYIQCCNGTIELGSLFTNGVDTSSGMVSSLTVKKMLQKIIMQEKSEDPLSDEEITGVLRQSGVNISRRTVSKYREQLDIPPAFMRRRNYRIYLP